MANFESEIISYLETLHQINSVEDQALCYKTITVPFFLPCHFEIGGNYSSFRQIQMSTENDTLGSTRNIPRVNLISFSPPRVLFAFSLPSSTCACVRRVHKCVRVCTSLPQGRTRVYFPCTRSLYDDCSFARVVACAPWMPIRAYVF